MKLNKNWIDPLMKCMETAFIVDEKSKKIVWSNDSHVGCHCYETFFCRTDVCPFCPKLTENELYVWDYYDKVNRRWLKIKNILFCDGDRTLRAGNFNQMDDAMSLSHDSVQEMTVLQKLLNENQRIKDALEREATHDRMTGIYNRNRFNLDVSAGKYDEAGTGVLYFDLNNLKEVNDTYRHEVGDRLICCLSDTIRQLSDEIHNSACYRIGGDEFVLMMTLCSKEVMAQVLVRFCELIKQYENDTPPCLVAVGSAFSAEKCDAELLVAEADRSMYLCKKEMKSKK